MDDLCLIDDPHLFGMARTKTTEASKKSEQEKENTAKSEQVGRRAQTTSYRKKKELRRGVRSSKKDCDLNDGAVATQPSDLAGQQLAIRMSQTTAVEPYFSEATKPDQGEGMEEESEEHTEQRIEKNDENSETGGEDGEECREGNEEEGGSEGTSGSGSGIRDGST
ncbi:hypothetical protein Scep_016241 [Stephania cephalantha]|uniref:Uncharacterized protein n=1 Tax=Stephania cephalantha TaxID=152367 RepID=A0AAP0NT12_9MAGN